MPITHSTVVTAADDGVSEVSKDEWNAAHTVTTIAASGGTVTSSTPVLDLTQTWNAGAVAFTGINVNITSTASASTSLLLDLQLGGVPKFSVRKDGALFFGPNCALAPNNNNGFTVWGFSAPYVTFDGTNAEMYFGSGNYIGWSSTPDPGNGVADTRLYRDAAYTVAQRNGTNAQTFRVYNTYTDSSNFERLGFSWSEGSCIIAVEQGGTGGNHTLYLYNRTASPILFGTNNADRWEITADGFFHSSVNTGGTLGRGAPVTKTADFTVATNENWLINNKSGSTCTVTLPNAASYTGREIMLKTIQAQTVVSASSNVVPLAGGSAGADILAATVGKWATLVSDGTNWIIMQAA